ncbi:hypothetical protein AB835_09555 [Candidatus Endobugula sertula]|uniref:Uncharacterized protein n=1 Tax=Candidatus Endobugula sertula TaxID=62101 RepID=A0A1D2QP05_9GAMM|nr:hypothetical protein AB835_09555 [Candidatus Endobugula sertula]
MNWVAYTINAGILKKTLSVKNHHQRSKVLQDIHAKELMHYVVLAAAICAKLKVEKNYVKQKYQSAINAIPTSKNLLVKLIGFSHKKVIHYVMSFVD